MIAVKGRFQQGDRSGVGDVLPIMASRPKHRALLDEPQADMASQTRELDASSLFGEDGRRPIELRYELVVIDGETFGQPDELVFAVRAVSSDAGLDDPRTVLVPELEPAADCIAAGELSVDVVLHAITGVIPSRRHGDSGRANRGIMTKVTGQVDEALINPSEHSNNRRGGLTHA
ncbi:MAG: hypothetical protein ACRD03_15085 [Acidimicrobiales bacterium]